LTALWLVLPTAAQDVPGRPNIILVMPDDAGYGDYACLGNPIMRTPSVESVTRGRCVRWASPAQREKSVSACGVVVMPSKLPRPHARASTGLKSRQNDRKAAFSSFHSLRMKRLFFSLLLVSILQAQNAAPAAKAAPKPKIAPTLANVAYGTHERRCWIFIKRTPPSPRRCFSSSTAAARRVGEALKSSVAVRVVRG
jgi:hypothetical protein